MVVSFTHAAFRTRLGYSFGAVLLLGGLGGPAQAQAPTVTAVSPARNTRAVPLTSPVAVTFSQTLASNASTAQALRVFSLQAGGQKAGTTTVSDATLTFVPSSSFKAGEQVSATVTRGVQNSSGVTLSALQVFQFTTATQPSAGVFDAGRSLAVAPTPLSFARPVLGDVNGDGNLDVLFVGRSSAVAVYLGDGKGGFQPGSTVSMGMGRFKALLGDFDEDGDLDLVTLNTTIYGSAGPNAVSMRLNNGQGVFSGTQEVAVRQDATDIALGDLDGDGDLDLAVCSYYPTRPYVDGLFNNGQGAFTDQYLSNVTALQYRIASGDVNNDGTIDLFSFDRYGAPTLLRNEGTSNSGTATFSTVTSSPSLVIKDYLNQALLADMNGDGRLDIVALSGELGSDNGTPGPGDGVRIQFNGGRTQQMDILVPGALDVVAGDVDGDGDQDLVITSNTAAVYLNDGTGSFTHGTDTPITSGSTSSAAALADIDNNGTLDLITMNLDNTAGIYLNQPTPPTPPATVAGIRLHAGGGALTTTQGVVFAADQYYSLSSAVNGIAGPIAGTLDPALYQSERYSTNGTLGYALPVANGQYTVVLHFAEIYWTHAGQRVFDINLEGSKVLGLYDIVKKVGPRTATTETFTTTVTDGVLNLDLVVPYLQGGADQAKLSALEVLRIGTNSSAGQVSLASEEPASLSAYPNPSPGAFTLVYAATVAQVATLRLIDPMGNVRHQREVALQAGENHVSLSATDLPEGLYRLTLRLANGTGRSQQLVIRP